MNKSKTEYTYGKGVNQLTAKANWESGAWQATDSTKRVETYITVAGVEKTDSDEQTHWTPEKGWEGVSKTTWQYDEAANLIQRNSCGYEDGDWVNLTEYKATYKDNNSSYKTLEQVMNWSTTSHSWVGSYKYEYEYDETNRQVSNARYSWNSSANDWKGESKSSSVWKDGKKIQETSYNWSTAKGDWVGSFNHDYKYDQYGHEIQHIQSSYNTTLGIWRPQTKHEEKFDGKHSDPIKTEDFYWVVDPDDEEDGWWCHTSKSEVSYDETAAGRKRYDWQRTYSTTECDVITLSDHQQYYYSCDNYFTVQFLDWDGELLAEQSVLEGYPPYADKIQPTREPDAQYIYTFNLWDRELENAFENTSYTAQYKTELRQYTVIFKDEDEYIWQTVKVDFGKEPEYTNATPTKEGDAQHSYTFVSWGDGIVPVHGDTAYIAKFESSVNQYLITFLDEDGLTELDKQTLDFGSTPEYQGTEPTKAGDAQYTYTFAGWSPEIVDVTGNATYKATYSSTVNKYDITFAYGEQSHVETLEYGAEIATDWGPTLVDTDEFAYAFEGWKDLEEGATVSGAASFEAVVSATKKSYDITFVVGTESFSATLEYGTLYALIVASAMNEFGIVEVDGKYQWEDAEYIYTFTGWEEVTELPEKVTESATFTMTFDKTKKTPTEVETVTGNGQGTQKVWENGTLIIIRDGERYNAMGEKLD